MGIISGLKKLFVFFSSVRKIDRPTNRKTDKAKIHTYMCGGQLATHVIWTRFYFVIEPLRTQLSITDNHSRNRKFF